MAIKQLSNIPKEEEAEELKEKRKKKIKTNKDFSFDSSEDLQDYFNAKKNEYNS